MGDPLTLSVVTPSFNTGRYLGAAIQSVIDQDWPGIDYIVMDGGSTDGSLDVLRSFGDRIRWVSEKDQGQSDAINRGFSRTRGDVLAWLNSDDTYAPGAVRTAMQFLAAHPDVAMVYGDADYIDADGKLIAPCAHIEPFNRDRLFHYSDFIVQPAAFFRRSAFEAVGGLDVSLNWTMDYDLWMKLAERFKIAYLPRLLAHYRWLIDNKTATGGFARIDEISSVLARRGLGTPAYVRLERVNLYLQQVRQSLREGRPGGALAAFAHATGTLLSSHRAVLSMFQPRTWRIIWTGQVLRARGGSRRRQGDKGTRRKGDQEKERERTG
jgi:glycosyltransferase involved in cell wall biosynthesis